VSTDGGEKTREGNGGGGRGERTRNENDGMENGKGMETIGSQIISILYWIEYYL